MKRLSDRAEGGLPVDLARPKEAEDGDGLGARGARQGGLVEGVYYHKSKNA